MNSNEYREQIRREIEGALGRSRPGLAGAPAASVPESARQSLAVLGDPAQSAETRRAALQALQQLSFNVKAFAAVRAEYIAVLRRIVDDPDAGLREGALETLAQEKDEFAQRRLLAGGDADWRECRQGNVDHARIGVGIKGPAPPLDASHRSAELDPHSHRR